MRKNCADVLAAWNEGRSKKSADSIWTDGNRIMSYGTCLVDRDESGDILVNVTKYSQTTTIHQNALRAHISAPYRELDNIPRGTYYLG